MISLTPRQKDVVSLLLQGLSNRDIANWLAITEGVVKLHLTKIFIKAKVTSRHELIVLLAKEMYEQQDAGKNPRR